MGSDWRAYKIGDLGRVVTGKTPSTKIPKYFGGQYPFITIPDMGTSVYISETARTLSQAGAEVMRSCRLPKGSVMMSCIATIGKCGITIKDSFTNQQINSVICDHNKVHPLYLYYVFTQLGFELDVAGGGGSVYTNVSKSRFSDISIVIPPLPEQRAIAHILGSLDDKIELNRQMNKTLEAMGRAIFKSWFVDFDPVRAKAEGRPTGLPDDIAALFPDSFENSELGEIPKGWEIKTIGQAVKCVGGSTPNTKNSVFWDGGKNPFITPKDMSSLTSPVILETSRHITDAGVEKISSGRLPIGTVILSSRAPIGYLAITEVPVSVNQGVIAMICNKDLPNYYVLHWTETNMETIKSNAGGTTFAEISKRNFRPIPVVVPQKLVLKAFVQQVEPMHQQVALNLQESNTLATLRDTLLPKLISGEMRVPDAEKFVEEAGL